MTVDSLLPSRLYRAEQTRVLDHCAIHKHGIRGITLMRRAAQAALDKLLTHWPDTRSLSVWCGTGNNGGDGYVLAGLAKRRGLSVQLIQVGDAQKLKGDALLAKNWAQDEGVQLTPWSVLTSIKGQLLVDALLGTGLVGDVREPFTQAIQQINLYPAATVALDIPSGLCSDTGAILGGVVRADLTVSFVGLKQGLLTGAGPGCCGVLEFDGLALPEEAFSSIEHSSQRIDSQLPEQYLMPRSRSAHKGLFGHVLVLGGNIGMGGAAIMAAEAASRAGAGLVSLATRPEHVQAALVRCPEIMTLGVDNGHDITASLKRASVLVIGPGLGTDAWSEQLLREALASGQPLVVDADALNLLCSGHFSLPQNSNWIITPHPGEAARLLGTSSHTVQCNRFDAARALQKKLNATVVLKGAGTLICHDQKSPFDLCSAGNPGMATGGMGDILSGILGGVLAQGFALHDAARIGVCLHAVAADRAAIDGERGMRASDLLPWIQHLANP